MLTKEWWQRDRLRFELFTSQLVLDEASAGDPAAAAERLDALSGIPLLAPTAEGLQIAERLEQALSLPQRAMLDAGHVAVAAVHGMSFLLTWNCKHLANGMLMPKIEQVCTSAGYAAPQILTPGQLT